MKVYSGYVVDDEIIILENDTVTNESHEVRASQIDERLSRILWVYLNSQNVPEKSKFNHKCSFKGVF